MTEGVGLPEAMHFRLTEGPGCSVCSMKRYFRTGIVSVEEKHERERERIRSVRHLASDQLRQKWHYFFLPEGVGRSFLVLGTEGLFLEKYEIYPVSRRCRTSGALRGGTERI